MPIGQISFTNITNNKKSTITSNDLILYTNQGKLYFKNQEIMDKGNQNDISTVGTITTGIWEATIIDNNYLPLTLSDKILDNPTITKIGIGENTLLVSDSSENFLYKQLQLGEGLNLVGSSNSILKLNMDSNTNTNYNSFSSNAYWISPPFINNSMNSDVNDYQTMNLAYQNLAVEFDHYILPKNVTATNLTLIQSEESTTTYDINIIKNKTTYSQKVNLISDVNTKLLIKSDINSLYSIQETGFTGVKINDYYEFNGIDDHFTIPANIAPELGGSDITIEFFTKLSSVIKDYQTIYSQGINVPGKLLSIYLNNTVMNFSFYNRNIYYDVSAYFNIWTHFAFTYDNSATTNNNAVKMYINGSLVTNPNFYGNIYTDEYLNAYLKKLKIWNSVRTINQISSSLYYNGSINFTLQNDNLYLDLIVSNNSQVENLLMYIPMYYNTNNNIYYKDYKSFSDISSSAHTITQFGSTHNRLKQSVLPSYEPTVKFGSTSIYFSGNNDYLQIANHNDFDLIDNNFTIEFWAYILELNGLQTFITQSIAS